jgi:AsmA protein
LLHGQLQIGRVAIDGLDLTLKKNSAGRGNWEGAGRESAPGSASDSGGETLQDLAGVLITDSRIAYQDTVLEHVNLEVGRVNSRSAVPVKLKLDLASRAGSAPLHLDGQGDVILDMAAKRYRLAALHVRGAHAAKSGAAPLAWDLTAPEVSLDLDQQAVSAPQLVFALGAARLTATLAGNRIIDAPTLGGSFQLAPFSARDYMAKLGMTPPITRDPRALSRLAASGHYAYGGKSLRASQLDVKLDDSTLRGDAAVTDLDTMALNFALSVDRLDIDRYLGPPEPASAAPPVREKPAEIPSSALKSLDANGTMTIGAARISGLNLTNVRIGVHAGNGITRIAPATAQLYGGQYSGAITLDERASESVVHIDQSMSAVEVAPLLNDLAKTKRLSGRGNVTGQLTAHGRTGEDLIRTLSGRIEANLANGAVEGIDLWYEINRAQSLLRQQALPSGSSTGRTGFDTFKASADLSNGVATTRDLNIASQLLRVTGQGSTNLVSKAIDYDVKATLLKSAPAAAKSTSALTLVDIPVKVSGTIASPTVRPDLGGLARSRLQQELNKHKDDVQRKLEDQLQKLLHH